METLAARIRRLSIRIFMLQDRLERAKSPHQAANIHNAIDTSFGQMSSLAQQIDLERMPPGAGQGQ